MRAKSHTSHHNIVTDSILLIQESPACRPINGFQSIPTVAVVLVVMVQIAELVFCLTVCDILQGTQSLFVYVK